MAYYDFEEVDGISGESSIRVVLMEMRHFRGKVIILSHIDSSSRSMSGVTT